MKKQTIIKTPQHLYSFILDNNLNTSQVNKLLDNFLIKKCIFIFDSHTPAQIVEYLKIFFEKEFKGIFIDYNIDNFDIKDFYKEENNLVQFK